MIDQIGVGVMNSDYTSKELLSLTKSSSNSEGKGDGDSDNKGDGTINHGYGSNMNNVTKRKKLLVFKPVSNLEHLVFEKDILFISPKQFNEAILKYAINGEYGVEFVKNDKLRVRVRCQPPYKFTTNLEEMPREMSY